MLKYFVSFIIQHKNGIGFTFGNCAVELDCVITGSDIVKKIEKEIKASNDILEKHDYTYKIINWRRFEDA